MRDSIEKKIMTCALFLQVNTDTTRKSQGERNDGEIKRSVSQSA